MPCAPEIVECAWFDRRATFDRASLPIEPSEPGGRPSARAARARLLRQVGQDRILKRRQAGQRLGQEPLRPGGQSRVGQRVVAAGGQSHRQWIGPLRQFAQRRCLGGLA